MEQPNPHPVQFTAPYKSSSPHFLPSGEGSSCRPTSPSAPFRFSWLVDYETFLYYLLSNPRLVEAPKTRTVVPGKGQGVVLILSLTIAHLNIHSAREYLSRARSWTRSTHKVLCCTFPKQSTTRPPQNNTRSSPGGAHGGRPNVVLEKYCVTLTVRIIVILQRRAGSAAHQGF